MKKLTTFLIVSLIAFSVSAQTIWDQAGGSIYSNAPGSVIINSPSGYTTATRLAILPPTNSGVSMVIGEALTGMGHTSISMGISEYKNGYSYLQAIKASGSAYGDIIMNLSGGKVGIGTDNPGEYRLAVEGKIGAREVKVTLQSFADYVFERDYKLMNLTELDIFIQKNKHLPNIPSAAEVKENGGIDLGEMNVKLLEKIEELTLHVIELNKKVEELQKDKKDSQSKK